MPILCFLAYFAASFAIEHTMKKLSDFAKLGHLIQKKFGYLPIVN